MDFQIYSNNNFNMALVLRPKFAKITTLPAVKNNIVVICLLFRMLIVSSIMKEIILFLKFISIVKDQLTGVKRWSSILITLKGLFGLRCSINSLLMTFC